MKNLIIIEFKLINTMRGSSRPHINYRELSEGGRQY